MNAAIHGLSVETIPRRAIAQSWQSAIRLPLVVPLGFYRRVNYLIMLGYLRVSVPAIMGATDRYQDDGSSVLSGIGSID